MTKDFIIHPGETLLEVLSDRNINLNELAIKTKTSLDYINGVLSEKQNITVEFAEKLEQELDIEKAFWINLQSHYDEEMKAYNKALNSK